MSKIQLRPSLMKLRRQTVKWIILHHTAEMYKNPSAEVDNSKYQMPAIWKGVMELKDPDVNYHFVIEKIKNEYVIFVTRPVPYLCEWPDIDPNINNRAIHVAFLGSLDFQIPPNRFYEILAYRLINPLLRMYNISPPKIKAHNEVSNVEGLTCPGEFFEKEKLISQVRRFILK